jgi:O-antigen/teichoic acid export membrane protein
MDKPLNDLRALLRTGLSRSLVSLAIKVATAGLTYGMYVLLSRSMGAAEYGLFAFGLSLATVLAILASLGQQTAILRYWPEETGRGDMAKAEAAQGAGSALTVAAGLAIGAGLLLVALIGELLGFGPTGHLAAAALLVLPMALAEYWSSALRAQGSVWIALTPRDILWRLLTPLVVLALAVAGVALLGWQALLLTALVLATVLMLQAWGARQQAMSLRTDFAAVPGYWRERGRASRWFLVGTLIDSAALNLDIVFVGLLLGPVEAGLYFNAFRTAGLLTLFMYAITLVVAPMLARHYHAGEMLKAQAVTTLCAWAGFVFSLAVFVLFAAFGGPILALFGDQGEAGYWILIILSVGLLFDAATGPARIVLMMTGHERAYVRLFGAIMVTGLVVAIAVIPFYGILGAALVNAGARAIAQIAISVFAIRRIGLDPSLFGIVATWRLRGEASAPLPPVS